MVRIATMTTAFLTLALTVGCERASDDEAKAVQSQTEANEKIVAANKQADEKTAAAQAEADMKIAAANASFLKLREDYRHKVTNDLVDLDRKIEELEARSKVASDKTKADIEANLVPIRVKRSAFMTDFDSLGTASATTWDDIRARLDKEWAELKALVDKA
jgi:hypothetical protein